MVHGDAGPVVVVEDDVAFEHRQAFRFRRPLPLRTGRRQAIAALEHVRAGVDGQVVASDQHVATGPHRDGGGMAVCPALPGMLEGRVITGTRGHGNGGIGHRGEAQPAAGDEQPPRRRAGGDARAQIRRRAEGDVRMRQIEVEHAGIVAAERIGEDDPLERGGDRRALAGGGEDIARELQPRGRRIAGPAAQHDAAGNAHVVIDLPGAGRDAHRAAAARRGRCHRRRQRRIDRQRRIGDEYLLSRPRQRRDPGRVIIGWQAIGQRRFAGGQRRGEQQEAEHGGCEARTGCGQALASRARHDYWPS